MHEIKASDWKVLRRVHSAALEKFSLQVLTDVERLARDQTLTPHKPYLEIYGLMQERNRTMGRLFDDPRRSVGLRMLPQLRAEGLLSDEDFASLTPEGCRAIIELLLR